MYKFKDCFLVSVLLLKNNFKIVYYGLMTSEVQKSYTRKYTKGSGGRVRDERVGIVVEEKGRNSLQMIQEICEGLVVTLWDSQTIIPGPDCPPEVDVYEAMAKLKPRGFTSEEVPEVLRKLRNTHGKPRCLRLPKDGTDTKVVGVYLHRAGRTGCAGCFFASNPTDPECTLDCSPIDQVEEIRESFHPKPVKRSRSDNKRRWN